jgi:hypothetical protein
MQILFPHFLLEHLIFLGALCQDSGNFPKTGHYEKKCLLPVSYKSDGMNYRF